MRCVLTDKTAAPLPRLEGVALTGADNQISVQWDTANGLPDQTVEMVFRLANNSDVFTYVPTATRDSGATATPATLTKGTEYTLWLRPETPLHYGEWQAYVGTTDNGWISGVEAVIQGDQLLYIGADLVVVPKL